MAGLGGASGYHRVAEAELERALRRRTKLLGTTNRAALVGIQTNDEMAQLCWNTYGHEMSRPRRNTDG